MTTHHLLELVISSIYVLPYINTARRLTPQLLNAELLDRLVDVFAAPQQCIELLLIQL